MTQRYEKYKDSGVQWLGEIPEHWGCVRVKSLFSNIREKNNPVLTEERLSLSIDKGVTLYSEKTTNLDRFKEDCSQYLLAYPNDIVLNSMNMIVGAVGKSKYFGCVSPAYYVIRLRNENNQIDYYSWLLNIQKIRDVYRVMGKGIMAIDRGDGKVNTCRLKVPYDSFGSINIPVPPSLEQKAIVGYLTDRCTKIDTFIVKKQKAVENLQELKQRIIADAVTRGLNPEVKMKETNIPWLPEVPEHWEVKTLRNFITMFSEKGHKDKQLLSVTREQGVIERNTESKEENHNFIPEDLSNYKYVQKGDFVINKMKSWQGSYGVSNFDGIVSPAYFTCKLFGVNKNFFSTAIRSKVYVSFFGRYSKGIRVDQWDLSPIALKSIPFLLPPLEEQRQIVSYITEKTSKIDTLITNINKEIENIKEYKQRLISDVVTGQIKVC